MTQGTSLRHLFLSPVKANMSEELRGICYRHARRLEQVLPDTKAMLYEDGCGADHLAPLADRVAHVAAVRNRMLRAVGPLYDYATVTLADADIFYDPFTVRALQKRSLEEVVAVAPLMYCDGMPGCRFFDFGGFRSGGQPFHPVHGARNGGPVESLGAFHTVPARLLARLLPDPYTRPPRPPEPLEVEHAWMFWKMPCAKVIDGSLAVYHANLPEFGEPMHVNLSSEGGRR